MAPVLLKIIDQAVKKIHSHNIKLTMCLPDFFRAMFWTRSLFSFSDIISIHFRVDHLLANKFICDFESFPLINFAKLNLTTFKTRPFIVFLKKMIVGKLSTKNAKKENLNINFSNSLIPSKKIILAKSLISSRLLSLNGNCKWKNWKCWKF